jgi:Domain of unknown function (DUF6046)
MAEVADFPAVRGLTANLYQLANLGMKLPFPAAAAPEKGRQAEAFRPPSISDLGTPRFFAIQLAETMLPNEPLITVGGAKNIVKTVVAGGDGTVKEMIGADDWRIKIQGYAIREGDRTQAVANTLVPEDYPEEWLRKLVSLYKRHHHLKVECHYLSYFNIRSLVIENIDFPPVAGASDFFAYEITALSDESSLAKITRPKK